jgi:hypothetical protein
MTIQEMFDREDIYKIIEDTLPYYYREVFGKDVSISVRKNSFFKKLLIYPRLGVIVPRFPSKAVRQEIYAWFDVQNNLVKKVIAKLYIFLCLSSFGIMAHRSLEISDDSVYDSDTLIIPSNRKIRIYYFDRKVVDSVIKDGFNDYYFNNEIDIRQRLDYDFVLNIKEKGSRWYREQLLRGRGLVRIAEPEYDKFLNKAIQDLKVLYEDTVSFDSVSHYADKLIDSRRQSIERLTARNKLSCQSRLDELIGRCKSIIGDSDWEVPLVLSHGDLQAGNIHIDQDNNKLYIIDWETGGTRSIWYDLATILCGTRRRGRFADMINGRAVQETKKSILCLDNQEENRDMDVVASVLLLEELGFYLDEMEDFPGTIGHEVIERFLYEMDSINWDSFRK